MTERLEDRIEAVAGVGLRSLENGIFHVHIPKTGGSTLNNAFKGAPNYFNSGHAFGVDDVVHVGHIAHFERGWKTWPTYIYDRNFRKCIRFAVIRSPTEWLFSYYYHNQRPNLDGWGWASAVEYHGFESFEQFAESFLDHDFEWHCRPIRDFQIAQCFDRNGKCQVDFLVYKERLNDAISVFSKLLGHEAALVAKPRNIGAYRNRYVTNPDLTNRLLFRFRTEMALFGYQKDGSIDPERALLESDGIFAFPDRLRFDLRSGCVSLD
ncbi:MAG: sulfotransferase family 2 domain-containing protein [Roseovarius indicus]|uniref:sulfotransferase family 2 domain-containing protein n=1 Tax=Roseovarius indicus TaxID=540747 RepID=UPI0032ED0B3C